MMKKILLFSLFSLSAFTMQAQSVSDFENIKLAEDQAYWDGIDMGDGVDYDVTVTYKSGSSMFPMSTSVSWGYGNPSNFIVSQSADVDPYGVNAAFTSITGSGFDGSKKYAVCTIDPSKEAPAVIVAGEYDDPQVVTGCYVTCTADLPNYLQNGRGFLDRNPYTDGDWLAVVATGYDAAGAETGTATVYLADYRDAAKADKWLKDWAWFDLSSLGAVKKISFKLAASDNHVRAFNQQVLTTASFCLDNFFGTAPDAAAVRSLASQKEVAAEALYGADGKQADSYRRGVTVVKQTYTDGTTSTRKVIK